MSVTPKSLNIFSANISRFTVSCEENCSLLNGWVSTGKNYDIGYWQEKKKTTRDSQIKGGNRAITHAHSSWSYNSATLNVTHMHDSDIKSTHFSASHAEKLGVTMAECEVGRSMCSRQHHHKEDCLFKKVVECLLAIWYWKKVSNLWVALESTPTQIYHCPITVPPWTSYTYMISDTTITCFSASDAEKLGVATSKCEIVHVMCSYTILSQSNWGFDWKKGY